jgi:hypothetical protein
MAQIWNFQTFYTEQLADLDRNLAYYNSLTGKPTEFSNPIIFRGLYKLAWDFTELEQETSLNEGIYAVELAAARATVPARDLVPARIITNGANGRFVQAITLYCKNIGIVIGAKIFGADNVDDVKNWILENEVFQETLPMRGITFTPTPVPGRPPVAATGDLSGVQVIFSYAMELVNTLAPAGFSAIQRQNIALFTNIKNSFYNGAAADSLCRCFGTELTNWNRLVAGYVNIEAGLAAAEAHYNAYSGGAFIGSFNAVKFLQNILLTMNRSSVADHAQYELTKKLLNNTPASFSSVKIETENEILERMRESTSAAAVIAVPQGAALVTSTHIQGFNTITEELITKMPKRLTHTCKPNCNGIYDSTPVVRVISYNGQFYVSPIQTRDKNVAVISPLAYANNTINTLGFTAIPGPPEVPGGIPPTPAMMYVGGIGRCACLDLSNGMPGPNPQPLQKKGGMTSTDKVSPCTTDEDDRRNMRNLPTFYKSLSLITGHGDWQSMPNYATCWLIKRDFMHDGVGLTSEGYNLSLAGTTGMKVFKFKKQKYIGSNYDTFEVPYDTSNCVLPTGFVMYALWPTGKLLYHNKASAARELMIDPPTGTYWKEWRNADYTLSYLAEIGYQEAKAAYLDATTLNGRQELSIDDQVELFQRGAFEKVDKYVATINRLRPRGAGGSGSNKMKRYNKKTMMSILKTAKRKYFTRRNKSKQ